MSEERPDYPGWCRSPNAILDPHVSAERAAWGGRNVCRCVARHTPAPLEVELHHVVPKGRPYLGPDTLENIAPICSTFHSSIHLVLRIFERHGGAPPRSAFRGLRLGAALRDAVRPALDRMGWAFPDETTGRL